jgi:hypothetical protein
MYLVSIDALTAALVTAIFALIISISVNVFSAVYGGAKEKKALWEALFTEIGWVIITIIEASRSELKEDETPDYQKLPPYHGWRAWLMEDEASEKLSPYHSWKELRTMLSGLRFDTYNYTRNHPTLYYQLQDAYYIEYFYRIILDFLAQLDSNVEQEESSSNHEDKSKQILEFMRGDFLYLFVGAIEGLTLDTLVKKIAGGPLAIFWHDVDLEEMLGSPTIEFIRTLYKRFAGWDMPEDSGPHYTTHYKYGFDWRRRFNNKLRFWRN